MSHAAHQTWPAAVDADDAFIALVDRYLSPDATAEDADALNAALRSDPSRLALFAALATESEHLREAHRPAAASPKPDLSAAKVRIEASERLRITPFAFSIAAALLLTAAAVAIYAFAFSTNPQSPTPNPSSAPIATLIDSTGTVVVDDAIANPGGEYAAGTYSIESGSAEFLLDSRVTVNLRGKTRLRMYNPMSASLESGSASFNCPPQATGFTVHLPDRSKVVDLGTAFTVEIDDANETHVRVTEGEVEWKLVDGDALPVRIAAGQSARMRDGRVQIAREFRPVIANGDFESPEILDDGLYWHMEPAGWSYTTGAIKPSEFGMRLNDGPLLNGTNGPQYAFINGDRVNSEALTHDTGITIVKGVKYTLSVDVGEQENQPSDALGRIRLYGSTLGWTVPFADLDNIDPGPNGHNTWANFQTTFVATAAQAGQTLGIALTEATAIESGHRNISFDNVTLTVGSYEKPSNTQETVAIDAPGIGPQGTRNDTAELMEPRKNQATDSPQPSKGDSR